MLITSIFSFSHNVFKRIVCCARLKLGLCGKQLMGEGGMKPPFAKEKCFDGAINVKFQNFQDIVHSLTICLTIPTFNDSKEDGLLNFRGKRRK